MSSIRGPGRVLYSPLLVPGSELNWGSLAGPQPFGNAAEAFKYLVAKDPAWEPSRFNGDADLVLLDTMAAVLNTPSPNLKPFFAGGGKLLMYHGWNDQQVPASSSVNYFTRVVDAVGGRCRGKIHSALHGAGDEPLSGRSRHRHVRQGWRHRAVDGAGRAPEQIIASHSTRRKDRPYAPAVPVSAGCRLQGVRQHRRSLEFLVQRGSDEERKSLHSVSALSSPAAIVSRVTTRRRRSPSIS